MSTLIYYIYYYKVSVWILFSEKKIFLILNEKTIHFENKIIFGYIKNFLLKNKKLFVIRNNDIP